MDHPEGAGLQRADRVDFDRRVRVEFRGPQISSDGGLLVMRGRMVGLNDRFEEVRSIASKSVPQVREKAASAKAAAAKVRFVRIADLRHWHRQCSVLGASHKVTLM